MRVSREVRRRSPNRFPSAERASGCIKKVYHTILRTLDDGLRIVGRGLTFGCVASEGGAPFVARRAMNPHGCAPPSFLQQGYPRERSSSGSGALYLTAPPLLRRLRRTLMIIFRRRRLPCADA